MAKGAGFGKTIFIGDQFVLRGVPAIVAALPYETVATVEGIEGDGWILEDNRNEGEMGGSWRTTAMRSPATSRRKKNSRLTRLTEFWR
jgi:mevalonate kinase